MEAIAYARYQREATRKVAQVLKQVRGKKVLDVQQILPSINKGSVRMISKTIQSAAANLTHKANREGHVLVPEKVFIKSCWSGKGPMGHMKRVLPAPMGRAMQIRRKVCHLTVIVSDGEK